MDKRFCTVWTPTGDNPEAEWKERRMTLLTASDISTAMGDNKYKLPTVLWEEKTGLATAPDISDKPAVKFGKENEARIREAWAEKNRDWCEVEYHQHDIYISKRKTFLGATLDGEIHVTSDDNPYSNMGVKRGDLGVLEIKTGGYSGQADLEARWTQAPIGYTEQIRGQMYVTGASFAVLPAELHDVDNPEDEELRVNREFFFKFDERQEALIVEKCEEFWRCVQIRKPPVNVIESDQLELIPVQEEEPNILEIPLEADATVGRFMDNFGTVKKAVELIADQYRGLVLTADDVPQAKKVRAELNKKMGVISKTRIAVKKKYCEPLKAFEDRAKELEGILKEAEEPIAAQIAYFEEQEKEAKKKKTYNLCCELGGRYFTSSKEYDAWYDNFFIPQFKDSWLNKSTSMKKVEAEIIEMMESYKTNLDMLYRHAAEDEMLLTTMLQVYMDSGDIGKAFAAEDRYREAQKLKEELEERKRQEAERRKAEEEKRRQEAEIKAQERAEAEAEVIHQPAEENTVAPQDSPVVEEKPKEIVNTFTASHTSAVEWMNLLRYMKEHGFKYKRVNN